MPDICRHACPKCRRITIPSQQRAFCHRRCAACKAHRQREKASPAPRPKPVYVPPAVTAGDVAPINFAPFLIVGNRWCVYTWRRDGEVLYVGQSGSVLHRLARHHVINKSDAVLPTDEITAEVFAEPDDMNRREKYLIYTLKPKFNISS